MNHDGAQPLVILGWDSFERIVEKQNSDFTISGFTYLYVYF